MPETNRTCARMAKRLPVSTGRAAPKMGKAEPGVSRVLRAAVAQRHWPTNIVETYSKLDGTIGLRTNTFTYGTNGIDLVQQIGPQGEQVVNNSFNAYHQPL